MLMSERDDPLRRRVGAEHVRHVGDRNQPDAAIRQQAREALHVEFAAVGDSRNAKLDAVIVPQKLPGDDIVLVLHLRDHHRLTGLHDAAPIAVDNEVHRLGAVAGEDDLVARTGVHEARHGVARRLESLGGALAHPMRAAMDVGVLRLHRIDHGVDHHARFHGRGGAIEKHQRLAAHRLRQDREIGAQARDVARHRTGDHIHDEETSALWPVVFHQPSTACSNTARRPS